MKIRPHTSSDYLAIAELRWHLKTDKVRGRDVHCKLVFIDRYQRHLEEFDQEGLKTCKSEEAPHKKQLDINRLI